MSESKNINFLSALLKKLFSKPQILKNIERPKYLPPYVPDCGFNHGKPDEES